MERLPHEPRRGAGLVHRRRVGHRRLGEHLGQSGAQPIGPTCAAGDVGETPPAMPNSQAGRRRRPPAGQPAAASDHERLSHDVERVVPFATDERVAEDGVPYDRRRPQSSHTGGGLALHRITYLHVRLDRSLQARPRPRGIGSSPPMVGPGSGGKASYAFSGVTKYLVGRWPGSSGLRTAPGDLRRHHADDPLQVVDGAELDDDPALGPADLDLDLGLEPVGEP